MFKKMDQKKFVEQCITTFGHGLTADIFFSAAGAAFFSNLGKLYSNFFPDKKKSSWMGFLIVYLFENNSLLKEIEHLMESGAKPIPELSSLLGLVGMIKDGVIIKDKKGRIASAKLPDGTVLNFSYYSQGMLVVSKGTHGISKCFFNNRGLLIYQEIKRPGQQKIVSYFKYQFDGNGKISFITVTHYQGGNKNIILKDRFDNIIKMFKNGITIFDSGFNQNSYFENYYTDEGVIASTVRFLKRPLSLLQWLNKKRLSNSSTSGCLKSQYDKYTKKFKQSHTKYDSNGNVCSKEYYKNGRTARKETYHPDGSINQLVFYKNDHPNLKLDFSKNEQLEARTEFEWDAFFKTSVPKQMFLFNPDGCIKRTIEFSEGRRKKIIDMDGTLTTFEYFSNDKSSPLFPLISKQITIKPNGEKTVILFSKYQGIVKKKKSFVKDNVKSTLAKPSSAKKENVPVGVMLMMQQQQIGVAQISNQRIGISKPGVLTQKKKF
ncbi:hypothetical protein K8S19_06130 [bacterium]|nr:hypothetical protein [bacterium]